jgi:hypothetical protein
MRRRSCEKADVAASVLVHKRHQMNSPVRELPKTPEKPPQREHIYVTHGADEYVKALFGDTTRIERKATSHVVMNVPQPRSQGMQTTLVLRRFVHDYEGKLVGVCIRARGKTCFINGSLLANTGNLHVSVEAFASPFRFKLKERTKLPCSELPFFLGEWNIKAAYLTEFLAEDGTIVFPDKAYHVSGWYACYTFIDKDGDARLHTVVETAVGPKLQTQLQLVTARLTLGYYKGTADAQRRAHDELWLYNNLDKIRNKAIQVEKEVQEYLQS